MKKVFFIVFLLFVGSFVKAQTGIGTTSPINKFEVVATTADPASSGSSANGNVRLGPSSGSHVLDFGLSSTSTYAWLQARLKSNYGTNYNLVLNPNGGPVGIGNKSPSATLTVGNETGTIGGEILLNPTSTQYEGGQIILKRSLQGSTVDWTLDQYGTTAANARFRIFNGSSETNGISILENGNVGIGTSSPSTTLDVTGNVNVTGKINVTDPAGNVATKAAAFVARGVDVTLGNLKARIAATGNFSVQLSTVSGSYSVYGSHYLVDNGAYSNTIDGSSPRSITTTPTYIASGNNFLGAGNTSVWLLMDTTAQMCWRITMIVGAGYNNNFISIERLL